MCRDEKLMRLGEAVRRITSLPAQAFGIEKRGQLKPGFIADVAVFDPATIRDTATYAAPHSYPVGIDCVIAHGDIALPGTSESI
jgi:N-acyl-D-aspartate/D-glutamate deacylase